MEEILFTCEICNKNFPADPDCMLECSADFRVKDVVTGVERPLSDEEKQEIAEEMSDNSEISPFLKGAICVCQACQEQWEKESESLRG